MPLPKADSMTVLPGPARRQPIPWIVRLARFRCAAVAALLAASFGSFPLPADDAVFAENRSEDKLDTPADVRSWDGLLTRILTESLAAPYIDEKRWGKQKNLTVGVRFERDGVILKPKRKRQLVNHGEWKRYEIQLDPAKQQQLKLETIAVRKGEMTARGKGMEIDSKLNLPLVLHARFSHWRRGVQLYSVEAQGTATVRVEMTCHVDGVLDTSRFPPALTIKPEVTRADVQLTDFELERVSDLHGPVVKQLGKMLHDIANDQLKKRRDHLVKKINRRLDKKADRFRVGRKAD